jgi:hypothetical protein
MRYKQELVASIHFLAKLVANALAHPVGVVGFACQVFSAISGDAFKQRYRHAHRAQKRGEDIGCKLAQCRFSRKSIVLPDAKAFANWNSLQAA